MSDFSSPPSLGNAVALQASQGDKFFDRVNRDQNLYYGRVGRERAAAKDKLITLKDFKFTGGLRPMYAAKEADLYSDYGNKLNDAINKHGNTATAVNEVYRDRQALEMAIQANKTNNDEAVRLATDPNAPNAKAISETINQQRPSAGWAAKIHNPVLGVTADEQTGAISGTTIKPVDWEGIVKDYKSRQKPTRESQQNVGKYKLPSLGEKQRWNFPTENSEEDKNSFVSEIANDENKRLDFLSRHAETLQSPESVKLYGNVFSNDPMERKSALLNAARGYADQVLTKGEKEFDSTTYHPPEGEKEKMGAWSKNHTETAYPETALPNQSGTSLRPADGNTVWTHYWVGKGGKVDVTGGNESFDKETGEHFTGTYTGDVRSGGTKPFFNSDGTKITEYKPYVNVVAYNQKTIDDYVPVGSQKTLQERAFVETYNKLGAKAAKDSPEKFQDHVDDRYQSLLHENGLPKNIKAYRTLEVPAKDVMGGAMLKKFEDNAADANRELKNQKPITKSKIASSNSGDSETFVVEGTTYKIPKDKVAAFKKAKGL